MTRPFYKPGSFYRIDDRTGFKTRAEDMRREWDNLLVREKSFEMRQPQDFVTGVVDDQNVPFARPRPDISDLPFINQNAGQAEFMVYGDQPHGPGPSFLVQNAAGPAYNTGLNTSNLNTSGTAEIQSFNGTVPAISAANFPNSMTGA